MLVELVDNSGQQLWINSDQVVRVDWASSDSTIITLAVVQEFNAKVRPLTVNVNLPAKTVVAILRGEQTVPAASHPPKPKAAPQPE
jgi:hypothetical protein